MTFKKNLFLLFFIFTSVNLLHSQQNKIEYKLSHPLNLNLKNDKSDLKPRDYIQTKDSVKIVAILVQFQEDNDTKTTGNGLFNLTNQFYNPSTGKDTVVDAPPYDSAYFADHLKFLKNYYYKASKGKLNINYDLFGKVINLPNNMQFYSPQRNESNAKLGSLFQDSWARADSFINFADYDLNKTAFVIFHAGAGRDIDLISSLGFDPTPFDIPSVYIGIRSLQEIYGTTYQGYQTNDGAFIKNSLIIPSTEIRQLDLVSGSFLLELGMNGILTASFGSYLGLPDLFNTSNGKTAIGRFGLMDGQSLFSYNGFFPPEPSAWEKVFLGWVDPIVISTGSGTYKIPASSKNIPRDSTIYKVLINSKEYFLIENKNRDPENNGQTIYSRNRTFNDSDKYSQDLEDGFYYSNAYTSLWKLNGNITDVENFDWSLPGLINNENNYRGGILIWHIDENVIDANYLSNTINNNIDHRGVDLEEAKGAQLIGVTYNSPFGSVTGDGTAVDYWFDGYHEVPSIVYLNSFNPGTNPNSLSYSLANNNIAISNFSPLDTFMTFKASIGSMQISPLSGFPKNIGKDSTGNSQPIAFDYTGTAGDEIFVNSGNKIYGFKSDGTGINADGIFIEGYGKYIPSFLSYKNSNNVLGVNNLGIIFKNEISISEKLLPPSAIISCPPLVLQNNNSAYLGRSNGSVYKSTYNEAPVRIDSASSSINQLTNTQDSVNYITSTNKYIVTGNINASNTTDVLIVNNNNQFYVNGNKLNLNYTISQISSSPVLADVNSDGKQEIIFVGDSKLFVLNSTGVLIENFPVDFNNTISSGISVADVNNDNVYDLLFTTSNGNLYAYGVNGIIVRGFPVSIAQNTTSTPALANLNDTLGIFVAGGDGFLYGFKTNVVYNPSKILWKNYLKDKYLSNNNFNAGNIPVNYSGKLPSDKVYNWPNPVYQNETFIRYFLNGNASSVVIKIMDLSGELVTTLNGTLNSNSDNEVKWDASSVQSGVYFGTVEAVIDGSKESQIFKIAVIR